MDPYRPLKCGSRTRGLPFAAQRLLLEGCGNDPLLCFLSETGGRFVPVFTLSECGVPEDRLDCLGRDTQPVLGHVSRNW